MHHGILNEMYPTDLGKYLNTFYQTKIADYIRDSLTVKFNVPKGHAKVKKKLWLHNYYLPNASMEQKITYNPGFLHSLIQWYNQI